jgi:hypothetical protein
MAFLASSYLFLDMKNFGDSGMNHTPTALTTVKTVPNILI